MLLACLSATAQRPLSEARRSSIYEYLYELNDKETCRIYKYGVNTVNGSYLHTLKDSVPHDGQPHNNLPPGNYLQVYAENDMLQTRFRHAGNVLIKSMNNGRDLIILLHDLKGDLIRDADVRVGKRRLHYNPAAQSWMLEKYSQPGILQVRYQGVLTCANLERVSHYREHLPARLFNKVRYATLFHRRERDDYTLRNRYGSYVVYSKPIYKPGDTVRFKAFLSNRKGFPVNKQVLVRLMDYSYDVDTILTTLSPVNPGSYNYQFVLSPEMNLRIDRDYSISLETVASRKYDLCTYEGTLSDDEYVSKRSVYLQSSFKLEDYELQQLTFEARTDKKVHYSGEPLSVYCKATDENKLPVMDGQLQLKVEKTGITKFYGQDVFIPKTLWEYSGPMDKIGETKITLPDSIFPAADLTYEISCTFTNSNNERKTQTLQAEYSYNNNRYSFAAKKDTLYITTKDEGQQSVRVWIYGIISPFDTIERHHTTLPAAIKINPRSSFYLIPGQDPGNRYDLSDADDGVRLQTNWSNDTGSLHIENPLQLPFWYTVVKGRKTLLRGYDRSFDWQASTKHHQQYQVYVQYVWGGIVIKRTAFLTDPGGMLHVSTDIPASVFPGQTTTINIDVKDKYLKPVANADITAYAYTSKFDNNTPSIPTFSLPLKRLKFYSELSLTASRNTYGNKQLALEWEKYGRRMGLDSMLFFRFTHPSPLFTTTQPAKDSITQMAPFVFARGSMQSVHILYVDEVPVYYSMSRPAPPYSFRVNAGHHAIKMRTKHQLISFELDIPKGVKSFISVDSAVQEKAYTVTPMPDTLTGEELDMVNRYVLQLQNTFDKDHVYIEQGNKLYDVNYISSTPGTKGQELLIGPMIAAPAMLKAKDHFTQLFERERGYVFNIHDGVIKEKEQTRALHRLYRMPHNTHDTDLSDVVLTETLIDSLTREQENKELARLDQFESRNGSNGENNLEIDLAKYEDTLKNRIQKIFLFNEHDIMQKYMLSPVQRKFVGINTGYYRLLILLKDNSYVQLDHLAVKQGYLHYYRFDSLQIHPPNKESKNLDAELRKAVRYDPASDKDMHKLLMLRYDRLKAGADNRKNVVTGTIVDDNDEPLIGVPVIVKGTSVATFTDENGEFSIAAPAGSTLRCSYVGFKTVEQQLDGEDLLLIRMLADDVRLNEVVVTALGIRREQKPLGYAVSTITSERINTNFATALYGKAAGVKIIADPGSLDGARHMRLPKPVLPDTFMLPSAVELPTGIPESAVRSNFKDEGYWQPALKTDAHGKTSFTVTFPDDVTRWNAVTIAMSGKRQAGIDQTWIRAFKTLSGTLAMPAFAIDGDTIQLFGKTINYTTDSITVQRNFSVNDSLYMTATDGFRNALIDTLLVPVKSGDSLRIQYTVNRDNYLDGEDRKIPIIPRGTTENAGLFAALNGDTTLSYQTPENTPVTIYAETGVLPVLMDEIAHVQQYRYLCNEQLASKLKAFLLEKKIAGFQRQPFKKDKDIRTIIGMLQQSREGAAWGWWKKAAPSPWITTHVMEAMLMAKEQGYVQTAMESPAISYFTTILNTSDRVDTLSILEVLATMKAKIDYKTYIDTLIAHADKDGYDTIRITALQQKAGLPVNIAPLLKTQQQTVFGNAFWGKDTLQMFSNSIERTLLVYKILRQTGGHNALLQKMRNYFLEKRKEGHWNNTYQSALILETILPDVMEDAAQGTATLTINGKHITRFPYTDTLRAGKIEISKQGKLPIYFTAYQGFRNRQPEKVTGLFDVTAVLTDGLLRKEALQAGQPIQLEVTVDAKQTADYVLVEIPIPAGCSYQDKSQVNYWNNLNNEVHREHFKDRVSIFCTQLTAGKHTFTISLLPRYSGHYYLNPAKAEMQYFPVFMGRETLKQVYIY